MELMMKWNHIIVILAFCFSSATVGQVFTETSDAGVTISTATNLPVGTTKVNGEIVNAADADVDLYRFQPQSSGPFTVSLNSDDIDANLIIFNAAGQGLIADDDNTIACDASLVPTVFASDACLTLSVTGGENYFVAVGANFIGAFESNAAFVALNQFIDADSGALAAPTTEILGLVGRVAGPGTFGGSGEYELHLASSSPPPKTPPANIPATPLSIMFIMAAGLLLLSRHGGMSKTLG